VNRLDAMQEVSSMREIRIDGKRDREGNKREFG
jgi:hypothetical protein